jgi:hypothetical protein
LSAGWGVLGFGPGYLHEEGLLSGTGPWLPQLFIEPRPLPGWLTALLLGASGALLTGLALRSGFRRDRTPETSIGLLLLMIVVFLEVLAPNYPWYFLVAAAFLPLTSAISPWILTTFGFAFYDVIAMDPTSIPLRFSKVALYLTTSLAIIYDVYTSRLPAPGERGAPT